MNEQVQALNLARGPHDTVGIKPVTFLSLFSKVSDKERQRLHESSTYLIFSVLNNIKIMKRFST